MTPAEQEELRLCLQKIFSRQSGAGAEVMEVHLSRIHHVATFHCSVVTARLAGGEEREVFLKDFRVSELPKDGIEGRRERELAVYRQLLGLESLGTARLLGTEWDKSRERYWLVLERVAGMPLAHCEFPSWVQAAGWLGRMQALLERHGEKLSAVPSLLRHGPEFFLTKARLAREAASHRSALLGERISRVLEGYEPLVDCMASQPAVFVHGSFRPQNILVDSSVIPARICPVDWELAALGSAAYDLAFLCDGFEVPELDQLWSAYRLEAQRYGVRVPENAELAFLVNCFRLHKVLKALSESVAWSFSEQTVAKLVDYAERIRRQIAIRDPAQAGRIA